MFEAVQLVGYFFPFSAYSHTALFPGLLEKVWLWIKKKKKKKKKTQKEKRSGEEKR